VEKEKEKKKEKNIVIHGKKKQSIIEKERIMIDC